MDAVDEPDAQGLLGVDEAAGEDQLLGHAQAADAGQPLRAAPAGDDPEVDLRLTELRAARRIADVARERELATAAEREAVQGRDRRLRHGLEQPSGLVTERPPLLRLAHVEPAHVLDVGTRDECLLAGARQDDRAGVIVAGELAEPFTKLRERGDVERVQRLLPVDGDDGDRALAVDPNQETGTFPLRKSTISLVAAPGPNTSATPSCFSSSESSFGMVPPTTTSTSSAPFSFNPSTIRGTSVM